MTDQPELQPPNATTGDHAHSLAKAALGAVPFIGAGAVELFNNIVIPPLERRRDEWRRDMGQALQQLIAKKHVTLEDVMANDGFNDVILNASRIAMTTSQKEKHKQLRNAVLNSALPEAPEVATQQMFLRMIDEFTVVHVSIIRVFDDPKAWFKKQELTVPINPKDLTYVAEHALPELTDRHMLTEQIVSDLIRRCLIEPKQSSTYLPSLLDPRLTQWGRDFLAFISDTHGVDG